MTRLAVAAVLDRLHAVLGAYYAGDASRDDVAQLVTADVVWHVPGVNAIAGDHRGVDQVLDYFERRRGLASGSFRMRPRDTLVGSGDLVGVVTDGTATIGGVQRQWSTLGLYRLRGDRIAECWLLPLDHAAFDDVWRPTVVVRALSQHEALSRTDDLLAVYGAAFADPPWCETPASTAAHRSRLLAHLRRPDIEVVAALDGPRLVGAATADPRRTSCPTGTSTTASPRPPGRTSSPSGSWHRRSRSWS